MSFKVQMNLRSEGFVTINYDVEILNALIDCNNMQAHIGDGSLLEIQACVVHVTFEDMTRA